MAFSAKSKMRELGRGYTSEVDTVDEQQWCQVLGQFHDANIYQTWAYDEVRGGRKSISQLLLRKDGVIVAAAQARIAKLSFITAGIAYVRWGPMWRAENADPETFRQAIRALRNEYACRRGLVLRLYPNIFRDASPRLSSALTDEGFSFLREDRLERTILFNLNLPLETLRSDLRPHWHRYLKVAEKNGLEIIEGSEDKQFEMFIKIYRQMVDRKRFAEPNDIDEFRAIQRRLPDQFKMKVMLCKSGDDLCAGLVSSTMGDTSIYLFGATSNSGLKKRGSYLLHWKLIEWLKQNRIATYDLNGINPLRNPGTFKFKSDLCGKNGKDIFFLGRFDSHIGILSYCSVAFGDWLRRIRRSRGKELPERERITEVTKEEQVSVPPDTVASS